MREEEGTAKVTGEAAGWRGVRDAERTPSGSKINR